MGGGGHQVSEHKNHDSALGMMAGIVMSVLSDWGLLNLLSELDQIILLY